MGRGKKLLSIVKKKSPKDFKVKYPSNDITKEVKKDQRTWSRISIRTLLSTALSNKITKSHNYVTEAKTQKQASKKPSLPKSALQQRKQSINISLKLMGIET